MDSLPITLEINSILESEGKEQKDQQQQNGELFYRDGTVFIRYEELVEDIGTVQNTIKLKMNQAQVIRHGAIRMNQLFRLGEVTQGVYHTPLGMFTMATQTKQLVVDIPLLSKGLLTTEAAGSLLLGYQLNLNDQIVGKITFSMKFSSTL